MPEKTYSTSLKPMNESEQTSLIQLTQKLLDSIATGDWDTYIELCDPSLTSFEPEAHSNLVEGMPFHKFYFDNLSFRSAVQTTIAAPRVRMLGTDAAIVSYIRLIQKMTSAGNAETFQSEETRVWQKQNGAWKHVHFHRSINARLNSQ